MKNVTIRAAILVPLLACVWAVSAEDRPLEARDVIAAPDGAWATFLSDPAYANAYDAYGALGEVGYGQAGVDPDACRQHGSALEEAVRQAPVSIALHRARMLCAEAAGDDVSAEEAMLATGALSRLALSGNREGFWPEPARVMGPADVYALLASAGLEYRYEYFASVEPQRYYPLVVAVWDDAKNTERHLWFDYIDTANSIVREDPFSGYPLQRRQLAHGFIESLAGGGDAAALDMQAVFEFRLAGATPAVVDRLRPGADAGGVQSLSTWLLTCSLQPADRCADGLVDALLPHAEQEHAAHTALLALAYALGVGVERDHRSAEALLEAADRRWAPYGATGMLTGMWTQIVSREPLPDFLAQRVRSAQAAGDPLVAAIGAALALSETGTPQLVPEQLRALADPVNNGVGKGYALLMSYHHQRDEHFAANGWMKSASDVGDANAQVAAGAALLAAASTAAQRREARALIERGAQGGSALGARRRAHHSMMAGEWAQAEGWLLGAVQAGDVDSILLLANLYEYARPGVHGDPRQAADAYRSLSQQVDSAEARRRLAEMAIAGRGMDKDLVQADAWLRVDAEKGDGASATRLGYALLTGELGARDEAQGKRWLEQAIGQSYAPAYVAYGGWYFYQSDNTLDSRRRGLELWRQGAEAGESTARNNFAWGLCTAPESELFDPSRGREMAIPLLEDENRTAWMDTVAACHAAAGEYERAVALQEEAIEVLPAEAAEAGFDEDGFHARLALYRQGKRYVEPHRVQAGAR
ncbi:tetratricopeptide repeat protein [Luteimonas sp. M1R5S18]|uniref:Tetratricopeptide repeat protein n=1 Tax=Luteimonas rhizosphaericola TaxID=3042024 RepID=A0ABT6JID3_9GAMM|nr:tetratricopeptide repeat protein [Luteimonas rhizosphaericola]MDH5830423.1 tetratricopeptide repeat protein [Luteimonas rhizosphaericola]